MLPLLIGTALALGIGIAIYINIQQPNEFCSADNGSRTRNRRNNKSTRSNKNYKVLICAICQDRIGSFVSTTLKCGHSFHTECLGDLIKHHHKKCPYCESDIEIRNI